MNGKLMAALVISMVSGLACSSSPTNLVVTTGTGAGGAGATSTSDASTATSTGAGAANSMAKAFFISTVYPDLATMPNSSADPRTCGSCHAPPGNLGAPVYLGADAETSYNVITNFPNFLGGPMNSALVVQGSVAHTGPGMNTQQLNDVSNWLKMEVMERGLGGTGQGSTSGSGMATSSATGSGGSTGSGGMSNLTVTEALAQYGQCMDYTLWTTPSAGIGLDQLATMQTQYGPCEGCHLAGQDGNWLSDNPQETFAKNQLMPFVTRQVQGQLDMNGNFSKLVYAQRWELKGMEPCDPSGGQNCHPQYTLPPNMIQGIQSFVNDTIQKFESGNCGQGGGGTGGGLP